MLSKTEREALYPLIYRSSHGGLSEADEAELRRIVASDYPAEARTLDRESLVSMACMILGAAKFARALEAVRAEA